jgi:hypothetical protein
MVAIFDTFDYFLPWQLLDRGSSKDAFSSNLVAGGAMRHFMIDDFGELHQAGSTSLIQTLGYVESGVATEKYAIENIGYVAITERISSIHIRFRPAIVSEQAIAGLYFWIFDHADRNIAISWLEGVWNTEHVKSCSDAVSLISHTLEGLSRLGRLSGPRIINQPSDLVQARWLAHSPSILPLLANGDIEDQLQQSLNRSFNGRWMIHLVNSAERCVNAIAMGRGYPPLHPMYSGTAGEFSFDRLIDQEYAGWVLSSYLNSVVKYTNVFENVDALINWPRFGEIRTRYWRVLIPFHQSEASAKLLTISGTDCSIDLRPKHIQKARQINRSF